MLALLLLLDHLQTGREVDALLQRAAAGQQAADYADRRVAGTVQYAGSQLTSGPPGVRADLQRLVQDEAQAQLPLLARRRSRVLRLRVLPWHDDVRAAQAAVAAHLAGREAALRGSAAGVPAARPDAAPARAALARVSSPRRAAAVYR